MACIAFKKRLEIWPFLDLNHVNFSTFWTSCFSRLERHFFVLDCRKRHFPGLYCLKKNWEKWPFLDLTPLEKCQFFFLIFWTSCFYSLERLFFVQKYRKRHFLGLYCLKKKVGKMAIFGRKSWVTALEKCQFIDFLNLFFYSLKRRFFVLEYGKRHFLGHYCVKRKLEKWQFLNQNHGLTPLEKCQFFNFLIF